MKRIFSILLSISISFISKDIYCDVVGSECLIFLYTENIFSFSFHSKQNEESVKESFS